jgi:hypothetical protein
MSVSIEATSMQSTSVNRVRTITRARLAGLLVLLACVPFVRAQAMRNLIEAALDEKISKRIEITERPIPVALVELEKLTGLHFDAADNVLDKLPYGAQTRISIVVQDMSVRRALTQIFEGLGLAMRVADDRIAVEPSPALERLGRRLTGEELELFQKLAAGSWAALKPSDINVEFRLASKEDPAKAFDQALHAAPPGSALAQLEAATQGLGWLWVPGGHAIVIYSRADDVQQRLDRSIDVSYRRTALDELLVDLGKRVGVTVHFEPGALQHVSARERNVDLVQRDTTVRQILELIGGNTGLVYEVVDDGIVIGNPPPTSAPAGEGGGERVRVVAILRVPVGTDGTTIDFLIRSDELPAEFKALRERKLPQVIELLRKQSAD